MQCTSNISAPHAKWSWRAELAIHLNLPGQCHCLLQDAGRSSDSPASSTGLVRPLWTEAKLSKCHFFKENITYLGQEISAKGMLPGQEGIEMIVNMGPPITVTGIKKFIGAVGYFHHFINNFSCIARPLDDLTSCENSKLKNHPVTLTPTALEAFETLKKKCMTAPVLVFVDLEKPFILETDASGIGIGLGAVLLQEQEDGKLHPFTHASRALHGSQKNYHSSKLEFLTLKWAIMEQF